MCLSLAKVFARSTSFGAIAYKTDDVQHENTDNILCAEVPTPLADKTYNFQNLTERF